MERGGRPARLVTRWWPVGVALLIVGAGAIVAVMQPRPNLSGGVEYQAYDPRTRQPIPEALFQLQALADAANCPVSDRPPLMASCVQERMMKVRYKAKLYKAKYEALVTLERDYWGNLRKAGLYPVILHCRSPKAEDCEGP